MCGPKKTLLLATMAATCVAIVVLSPSPSPACSPPQCSGGALFEHGATVPANANGFLWSPRVEPGMSRESIDTSEVEVTRVAEEGATTVPVEFSEPRFLGENLFFVKPKNGLKPNSQYDFRAANFCYGDGTLGGDDDLVASVQTGGEAQPFSDPGFLEIIDTGMGEVRLPNNAGACFESVDAYEVTVQLNPSDGLRQWSGGLIYRFFASRPDEDNLAVIDTVPDIPPRWTPNSHGLSVARPQASAAVICETPRDGTFVTRLGAGTWNVRVQAEHPLTGKSWESEPVQVTLSCSQGGDTGVDTGVDAGQDGGLDAGPGTRWPEGSGGPGGCFCSSNHNRRPVGGGLIVFLMGVALSRWSSRSPSA